MKLVQVKAPHFTAGFVSDGSKIVEAAPILRYLLGRPESFARDFFKRKGWKASVVTSPEALATRAGRTQ